ncbi:MAG: ABC transporter permease [Eubacterium sp.]|nr:ABC transporter permease [Eubacterium sp.]
MWKDKSVAAERAHTNRILWNLARDDFKQKFAGSYLGVIWAFVQPVVTVLVYWFVFEKALHSGTQAVREGIQVPYVLWLIAGLVPWFYFSDALNNGTRVLLDYSYLVKKVVFRIRILPVVRIISSMYVHLFFVGFMLLLYTLYGLPPTLHTIQIAYYSFGMILLCLGITYLTSAIAVFFRDVTQIVQILLQVGIWITPIMWNYAAMNFPKPIMLLLRANPMFYIVQGYRDALVEQVWFWQKPVETLVFWGMVAFILWLGTFIFRRLQVHFADVL